MFATEPLSGIATAEMAMRDLGYPVELGSGVAAVHRAYQRRPEDVAAVAGSTLTKEVP